MSRESRWDDVDLDAATAAVRRVRVRVDGEMVERPGAKTSAGNRVVDLDETTVAVLRRWSTAQKQERLAWGPAYADGDWLFTRENGEPLHADQLAKRFARLQAIVDVPKIRFHDVRHTHASLLLAAGTPVLDVSKRIGHESAAMTLDVYGHLVSGQGQRAAATFAAVMDRGH